MKSLAIVKNYTNDLRLLEFCSREATAVRNRYLALEVSKAKGCPQEGEFSVLFCIQVVDKFLWEFYDYDYYTVGYADDTAIQSNRKFPSTVLLTN